MKPVLTLAAAGLLGIGIWKLASVLLLPALFFVLKIGLIIGLVMLAFWFFNKKGRGKEDTPPSSA